MPAAKKIVKKPVKKVVAKKAPPKKVVKKAAAKAPRFTYSNLTFSDKDHITYNNEIELFSQKLDHHYKNLVNGAWIEAQSGVEIKHASPADTRIIVSHFPKFGREETVEAIRAARLAANEWGHMPYQKRIAIMRKAADLMYERAWYAAAMMAFEVGKPRGEGIAEVYEAAEIIRYYCDYIEQNKGFVYKLTPPGKKTRTETVLLPYGVFGVISPWNFPIALATGMSSASLIAGNAVVQKPASESPVSAFFLANCLVDAGLPDGVFNLVVGPGSSVGEELRENPMIDGIAFTGSYDVGMHLYKNFATRYPKPVIAEMGGKNPVIITSNADLDMAAEGTARGAFGFSGQKCSATSRAYVHKSVKGEFMERLVEFTAQRIKVGFPAERETFMGPVMNQGAVDTWQQAVDDALASGGRVAYGGNRVTEGDLQFGYYVQPTIVDNLTPEHRLFQDELFVPFLAVQEVESVEEAMVMANDVAFGLTAGIYSEDKREVQYFYDNIQAGVTYSNRRAGATTGAWPQNNTFGGWKGSGSTGHNAFGPHYLQHFMREQSRWIVEE